MKRLASCLLLGLASLTSVEARAQDWYVEYNTMYPNGINPITDGQYLGWDESYTLRSFISMYRASRARGEPVPEQEKWIAYLVEHCDSIVDNALRGNSDGQNYLVLEGHAFAPMARFVRMIFDDPALYAAYKDQANKYLDYLETVIVPDWRSYPYGGDPHNWYGSYGVVLIYLDQLSRSPHYQPPDYQSPDPTLAAYYYDTVVTMATTYFNDFG